MIYLDSSVLLARILSEETRPPHSFWRGSMGSSRLLEYEVWNRVNTSGALEPRRAKVRRLLSRIAFLELSPRVLARALAPFPVPVRTLDGLHLATMIHLKDCGEPVEIASYDRRLVTAAAALGIEAVTLENA